MGFFARILAWLFRSSMKLVLIALFIALGLFIGGFLQFTNTISTTTPPSQVETAEAIVALTGGSARIGAALDLLEQGKGKRLLISGVNVDTKMSDIASMHPQKADLFDCCVDLERVAENTHGNAVETGRWMQDNNYSSLIIVTSAYHMPRSLLEFQRQLPDAMLFPFPVGLETTHHEGWWKETSTLRLMVNEFAKYLGARAQDYLSPQTIEILRNSMWQPDSQ